MLISGAHDRRSARTVIAVAVALLLIVGAVAAWAVLRSHPSPSSPAPAASAAVIAPRAAAVGMTEAVSSLAILRDWDRRRAEAWRTGDRAALRRLYVRDAAAGRRDLAMLRRWLQRGLRVDEMSMQVLAVELRARSSRRLVLVVTDRLATARAVRAADPGAEGATDAPQGVALPRDTATVRRLVFQRIGGRWLLAGATERS